MTQLAPQTEPARVSSPFRVLALCLAVVTLDGFDAQVMAYVSPKLAVLWHVERASLGPALSAGLFGLMLGALLLGPAGDRIGRKPMLLLSTLWFGAFALATMLAATPAQMVALRFLTGIGLGGAMPIAIALVSEHAPINRRRAFVALTVSGFAIGPAIGGFVAGPLILRWGWQALFFVGGLLPLMLVPLLLRLLPGDGPRAALGRNVPIAAIFSDGRMAGTLILWLTIFLNLLVLNLVLSWMPIIISDLGFSYAQATSATAMFHVGGVIGGLTLSMLADRFGLFRLGAAALLSGAIAVVAVGNAGESIIALRITILFAGLGIVGALTMLNALSGLFYPSAMRATGSGWALGIGRLGAAVGPLLGALLLEQNFSHQTLYFVEAMPLIIAAAGFVSIGLITANRARIDLAP